jgi:hypothetical protein
MSHIRNMYEHFYINSVTHIYSTEVSNFKIVYICNFIGVPRL